MRKKYSEIMRGRPPRVLRALDRMRIRGVHGLCAMDVRSAGKLRGIGPVAMGVLREIQAEARAHWGTP